ncbi:hypothetical protein LCGC14_1908280 [marine sediment metagenome]|uniref:Uncharacterized protein n=1 Tax=marine sediment metagenome TaxID=412755 RepID=A0A0F9I8D1_9ZZZZ
MKTELEIAKENIQSYLKKNSTLARMFSKNNLYAIVGISLSHKQSCQRFLEFFGDCRGLLPEKRFTLNELIEEKITDLHNAIKLYEENGV